MSITLCWTLFNAYVPIFLRGFLPSSAVVGLVMSLDNVAGMTLQPWFGGLSDRTKTRFGRRMPYILAGMPLAALAFPMLPLAPTLALLVLGIVAFDFTMSVFRAPTVALMPDLTPEPLRSRANAVINIMGALGGLLALFGGAALYRESPAYPFFAAALVLLVALVFLVAGVREPRGERAVAPQAGELREQPPPPAAGETGARTGGQAVSAEGTAGAAGTATGAFETEAAGDKGGIVGAARRLPKEDLPLFWTLLALFGWSLGQSALEAFFTTYTVVALGWNESAGAFMMGYFALAYLLFALPAGWLGARWGLHKALSRGLAVLVVVLAIAPWARTPAAVGGALAVAGAAWSVVAVNAYPRAVELGSQEAVGATTGLYYFFTSLAASSGPPMAGAVMDLFGARWLFGFSALSFAAAWLCMRRAARAGGAAWPSRKLSEEIGLNVNG